MVPFGFGLPRRNQPAHVQAIREKAADRIRTDDLLHGNYASFGRMSVVTQNCRSVITETCRS
ncbi:MAG: hypothetical protein WDZ46_05250, partial [Solirubrobacterales bacterium]